MYVRSCFKLCGGVNLTLALPLGLQPLEPYDGEIFNQALLDFIQPIVVRVELGAGIGKEAAAAQGSKGRARLVCPC